ncbi:hypothetical protein RB614_36200 [Phytohabitans sp. ZYX-F-186]|uniref:Lipoprotein LpqB beta-propeller domain-containing protein n=1 Tax=Phytohabitans maris TaxID=3071409 RepID=A0ABU0ZUF5_9ACTN|nr:hypothetical protein [Phytohabitans sp. ZYX-F-186]MDQ7909954.1 hypothetical protein [Phytohabitans sp. ZYX-F-186]
MADGRRAPVSGLFRGRSGLSVHGVLALAAALVAAWVLLAQAPDPSRRVRPLPPTAEAVWPHARRADVPGVLSGGGTFRPTFFLDERASVGAASDPDAGEVRLVLRAAGGTVRVLRRLPATAAPQYAGFVRAGGQLVWAESVAGPDGSTRTELWRAELAGGAPRRITADTGRVRFFGSEHDVVVASGRVYWTSVAPGGRDATQVRSVPLGGGRVEVRTEPGAWVLSRWPWLASAGSSGRARLRSLATSRVVTVDAGGDMLDRCGPTWCRVFVLTGGGVRSELMRPDGSDRQRVADDATTTPIVDVAVLDRFEVLCSGTSALAAAIGGRRLLVYDLVADRLVRVADAAVGVFYRGGVLWWSTGTGPRTAWHALDLRTVR